jgi:hypothetical protein
LFFSFFLFSRVQENDRTSAAAVAAAEEAQKKRIDLMDEVKKMDAEQSALASAIAKNESRLLVGGWVNGWVWCACVRVRACVCVRVCAVVE